MIFKQAIAALLILIMVSLALKVSCKASHQLGQTTIAAQVIQAKEEAQAAKKVASAAVSKVKKRPALIEVVQVSSVLTPEVFEVLEQREQDDMEAIDMLQVALVASEKVVLLQDKQITQLGRAVLIYKIVAGVITVLLIIAIL